MTTHARVVVCPGEPGPLRVVELGLPDPGPHQVVVRQFASGVCHSQLHQMHNRQAGNAIVLGHESTGVVVAVGSQVTHVREGDHAFVTWVPRDPRLAATRRPAPVMLELPGGGVARGGVFTWADHTLVDELYVVKMPAGTATDVTAIIGCAVMTGAGAVYHTAGVKNGQSVAIFGVGGVGLSAIAAARIAGADPIIAVDLDDAKLELARRFGATHGVNAATTDPVTAIRRLTPGEHGVAGVDFAFDCIGVRQTMEQILAAARNGLLGVSTGGTAVLVGVPQTPVELNARDLLVAEKKYIGSIGGSCRPDVDFPMFVRWFEEGTLDLHALVSARYRLEDINEATAALERGEIAGRAILDCRL